MSIRTKVFFPAQQSAHNHHHSTEIRRWKVTSFQELQERIQQVLDSLDTLQQYRFEYLDDVNDWIVLEHPDEWDEAIASSSQGVLVVRIIPRVVQQKRCPHHHQRPPTRRGHPHHHPHCAPRACPRQQQQQQHCHALTSGLAGALQALPFIIQLAAPVTAQGKRTVPIYSSDVPSNIEIRRTKSVSVPVEVEAPQESAVEIPVTKAAPRVIRRIPIVDAADEIQVKKCSSIEVEAPAQEAVEIPVSISPVRPVRSIPIEEESASESVPQSTEEEAPLVEKEESKPLEVAMSGIIENDYTIENDEDASEIIVDEDKEDEEEQQKPASPQAPSQEWQNEEELLQSMGFQDSKLNFHLLRHNKGNMERTINSLLQLEQ